MGKGLNSAVVLIRRFFCVVFAVLALLGPAWAAEPDTAVPGNAPSDHLYVVISLADRRLYLVGGVGDTRASFPVAIGRPGVEIPLGVTTVVRKRENPTWHPTANQRRSNPSLPASVPPGPDNPLGRFALDLGWPTYAIHGTNDPDSIGRRASGGCFRLGDDDIETLFAIAGVGTPVRVMAEAYAAPRIAAAPVDERGVVQLLVPLSSGPPKPQPAKPAEVTARIPAPPPPPQAGPAMTAVPVPKVIAAAAPALAPLADPLPADPRCSRTVLPVLRVICDSPDLAQLDGRIRQKTERLVSAVPSDRRAGAADAMTLDRRRFEERISALCWVRAGTERDQSATATARLCLKASLESRLEELDGRAAY